MKAIISKAWKILFLLLLCFMSFITVTPAAYSESIAVIVNPKNSENIDILKLKRIFTKDYRIWANGKDIVPVNLKDSSGIYDTFVRKVIGKDSTAVKSYWIQQRITKNIKEPIRLNNSVKVKNFVKKVDNTIGYIFKKDVDDSVKVLLTLD